jgi:threonine synthase
MYVEKLVCSRCGEVHYPDERTFFCSRMDGRLDIYYDYDSISNVLTKDLIERRRNGIWRYKELLPTREEIYLGEGGTPLIKAGNLSEELHVDLLEG